MGSVKSKDCYPEELKRLVEMFYSEFMVKLQQHHNAADVFSQDYFKWLDKTIEIIVAFEDIVKDIEKHHRNVNIASLSSSSISLAGGAACLAGLALAPVTGGLSVALSVGGLIGTSAGTLASQGARIVEFGLQRDALKKASNLVDDHCQETLRIALHIENYQLQEEEILNFLQTSPSIPVILKNKVIWSQIITNAEMKERLARIEDGSATLHDYFILISFLSSKNFCALSDFRKLDSLSVDGKVVEKTIRLCSSLRNSILNVRKCVVLLKNWRSGLSAFRVTSKASRFAKGALLGLSLAADLYDISITAKDMVSKRTPDDVDGLRAVIEELVRQKNEVTEFYVYVNNLSAIE